MNTRKIPGGKVLQLVNIPKSIIVLAALVCVTALLFAGHMDDTTGAGLLGMIIGYGVGNGIAAKQGDVVEPVIGRRQPQVRHNPDGSTDMYVPPDPATRKATP